jgi:hypothetical protein
VDLELGARCSLLRLRCSFAPFDYALLGFLQPTRLVGCDGSCNRIDYTPRNTYNSSRCPT